MNINNKLSSNILELRKDEKDFLLRELTNPDFFETGESEYLKAFDETYNDMQGDIVFILNHPLIKNNTEQTQLLNNAASHLVAYRDSLNAVILKLQEKGYKSYGLIGHLRASVHNIEEEISTLKNSDTLMILMLSARRAEKDYFLRNDLKYQEKLHEIIKTFKTEIEDSHYPPNTQNTILALLDDYQLKFDEVVAIDTEIGRNSDEGLTKAYRMEIYKLEPVINQLHTEINAMVATKVKRLASFISITLIVIIVISIIIALTISGVITKPLNIMLDAAKRIADGRLDVEIANQSTDEIGQLALAFNEMTMKVNNILSDINAASDQVATGSKQVSDTSVMLAQGATEQASSIQQLSAALSDIAVQTEKNVEAASNANDLSKETTDMIIQSNHQMKELTEAMALINQSSIDISKIIKVIEDIAFQTNILALNAAVEAARAGQHGKGFAVVAEEVRNLAERSSTAAKETAELISDSINRVKKGADLTTSTGQSLDAIVTHVNQITQLIQSITVATISQADDLHHIDEGINQISDVVQTTSATSEETAATSTQLSEQAKLLKTQIMQFRLKEKKNYMSIDFEEPSEIKLLD